MTVVFSKDVMLLLLVHFVILLLLCVCVGVGVDWSWFVIYSKTCVKRPLSKRQKNGFQDQLSLNAGQKCCRTYRIFIVRYK